MAFLSQWPSFDLVPRFDTDMPSNLSQVLVFPLI